MNAENISAIIFGVLYLLAVLPALWMAKKILVFLSHTAPQGENRGFNQVGQLVLWMALGGLFMIPLLDILSWIQSLLGLFTPQEGKIMTSWGTISPSALTLLSLILTAIVYAPSIWLGKRAAPIFDNVEAIQNLSRLEKTFILLVIAGLTSHLVRNIVLTIVLFQFPNSLQLPNYGMAGFLMAWLVGILLISLIVIVLYNHLSNENIPPDRIS